MGNGEPSPRPSVTYVDPATGSTGRPSLAIAGHIGRTDIDELCEEVAALLARPIANAHRVDLDVAGLAQPDVAAVDALARVQLVTRRLGIEVVVCGACPELRELIGLVGLRGVLSLESGSGVEVRRKTEEREEALRVEEERDP